MGAGKKKKNKKKDKKNKLMTYCEYSPSKNILECKELTRERFLELTTEEQGVFWH
jgi:hypothetical protein